MNEVIEKTSRSVRYRWPYWSGLLLTQQLSELELVVWGPWFSTIVWYSLPLTIAVRTVVNAAAVRVSCLGSSVLDNCVIQSQAHLLFTIYLLAKCRQGLLIVLIYVISVGLTCIKSTPYVSIFGLHYISTSIDAAASTSTQLSDYPSLSCEYYRFIFLLHISNLVLAIFVSYRYI
jgi:hypothetical protein